MKEMGEYPVLSISQGSAVLYNEVLLNERDGEYSVSSIFGGSAAKLNSFL